MKRSSIFHIGQKMEFEKFNSFFFDFLGNSFVRIKVILTAMERESPDINWQICFTCQLTSFYMIRSFTEWYFYSYIDHSYILESHFYFVNVPDYFFKLFLSWIFCVNSSVKVLSPQYEGPTTNIFRTSVLCTFIIYRKKEIDFRS